MLKIDDLFRIEQIGRYFGGPFSFSPDGKTLAYVVQRANETRADTAEGHVLQSPVNIKDMWRRIFAWFEEFSGTPTPS